MSPAKGKGTKPAVFYDHYGENRRVEWLAPVVVERPMDFLPQRSVGDEVWSFVYTGEHEILQEELGMNRAGKVTFRAHRAPVFRVHQQIVEVRDA